MFRKIILFFLFFLPLSLFAVTKDVYTGVSSVKPNQINGTSYTCASGQLQDYYIQLYGQSVSTVNITSSTCANIFGGSVSDYSGGTDTYTHHYIGGCKDWSNSWDNTIYYGDNHHYVCSQSLPTCKDNEYLDSNNTCVPLSSAIPSDFPTDTNNSIIVSKIAPYDEPQCVGSFSNDLAAYTLIWDSSTQQCKSYVNLCFAGYSFDKKQNKCVKPADSLSSSDFANSTNGDSASQCVGGQFLLNYMASKSLNFCDDSCQLQYPAWSPPVGYDKYNLLCGHAYYEYRCSSDYRIKQFKEYNCAVPKKVNSIDFNQATQPTQNLNEHNSTLSAIDPTQANTATIEALNGIEAILNEKINPLLDEQLKATKQGNDLLGSIDGSLKGVSNKLDGLDSDLKDLKGSLDGIANSLNDDGGEAVGQSSYVDLSGIDQSGLDDTGGIMDNLANNLKDLTDGIISIKDGFNNAKSLIDGTQSTVIIPNGSCQDKNLQKFAGYIAPYSGIISLITYVTLMIQIFKMIFAYYARGEN